MSHIVSSSTPISSAHTVKLYPGFGILGADIPTDGDNGGSPVLNDDPQAGSEYHWRLETAPGSGAVTIYPDLSFSHEGAADGVWTWQYRLFEDGVSQGVATVTDTFGSVLLSILSATHNHSAENLTLDASNSESLAISKALHAHSADNVTLDTSNATPLTTQDATHAHAADNIGLTLDTWLSIVESIHAHAADNVSLSNEELLIISESLHSHFSDALMLSLPSQPGACPSVADIVAGIMAQAQITPIHADVRKVVGISAGGAGTELDPWGPV